MAKRLKTKAASKPKGWLYNRKLLGLLFFLLGFLLYANTFGHDYTQDDAIVIYDSSFTTQGIQGIDEILKYDAFRGFFKEAGKERLVSGGRYRPLSQILFALEYELFGLNPSIGHVINALLYGFSGFVLYSLLLLLFQPSFKPSFTHWVAFVATLLFVAHPIHTEVVANIKGRDEILALLGSMGALYFVLKGIDEKKNLAFVWASLCFFLGLLSKENTITFIGVIPMAVYFFRADYLKNNNWGRTAIAALIPLFIAAGAFIGMRGNALGWESSETSFELMNNPFLKFENNQYVELGFGEKSATITYTLGKYLQLLLVPHPLTHDYYPRHIEVMGWGDWQVILSLLLYLALIAVSIWGLLGRHPIAFTAIYFLGTLSIVSNIVFPIGTNMAERFLYMPSVAYGLVIGMLTHKWIRSRSPKGPFMQANLFRPVLIGLAIVSLLYAGKTIFRNFDWKDNYTLFTTDIAVSPGSAKLQNSVAGEKIGKADEVNDPVLKDKLLKEAVEHARKALEIHPYYKNPYLLMGNSYVYQEDFEKAIQSYDTALKLDPEFGDAINNRAIAFREAGKVYGERQGNIVKALEYLNVAYSVLPNDYETNRLLGVANGIQGRNDQAIAFFTKCIQLEPENAGAYVNLGNAYYNGGQPEQGAAMHQKALALDPNALNQR